MDRNMRKLRRILIVLMSMLLMTGLADTMYAANMKKSTKGITWGLKANKKITYYSYWGGVGMIAQQAKITKWKDQWTGNDGMRMLTFRITYTRKKKPSAKNLIKAATYYTVRHPELNSTSPPCYYVVVDYKTGMSLEDPNNPYGVIVSNNGWKQSKPTTYKTKGYSISMTNIRVDVTIEYPFTYQDMCIGIGGKTRIGSTYKDNYFWDGIYPFWMTNSLRSTKKKKIAHFGRWWY